MVLRFLSVNRVVALLRAFLRDCSAQIKNLEPIHRQTDLGFALDNVEFLLHTNLYSAWVSFMKILSC